MKQPLQLFNYVIRNQSDDTLDVHIDGVIVDASTQQILKDYFGDETSVSFKSIRDQINSANPQTVNFIINGPGGHVGDAMAIADLQDELKEKGITVNSKGTGIIASAATYPLLNAQNVTMTENAMMMIHNVSGGIYGTVTEVENYAKGMRKFNDAIVDFYVRHCNLSADEITEMMNAETWFTAKDAKEHGFISNISGKVAPTNKISPENWQFRNLAVLNAYNAEVIEESAATPQDENKSFLQNLKSEFMKILNAFKGALNTAKEDTTTENLPNKQDVLDFLENLLTPVINKIDEALENAGKPGENTITDNGTQSAAAGTQAAGNTEAAAATENAAGTENTNAAPQNNAAPTDAEKLAQLEQQMNQLRQSMANNLSKPAATANNGKGSLANIATIEYE